MKILVTIGGECFRAEHTRDGIADLRDGVLYYFKLTDLVKSRGLRNVSLFLAGPDKVFIDDFDARIEIVRLNVIRRAFDSGDFKFESSVVPNRYHELPLRAVDFLPQERASDETIRRYIKFAAYCLGFKHWENPNGPNLYVDFDCAEDRDYLGARSEDIGRNVQLLTEEEYLRPSCVTYANPLRVSPTAKLIRQVESGEDLGSPPPTGAAVTQHIHLHGHNPRVNMNSTDNSVNITSVSSDQLFVQLREAARSIGDESERTKIVAAINEMESAKQSSGFLHSYQNFMASAANHVTVFAPFISALAQMLSKG
jgi:hypothetical protein